MRVRGGDYDLIVVSLGMRGFDGLRLCSQLRSLPEGRNVPILVVVTDGDRRKLTQALEMGVNDYLTRPVDKNELVARVRTQLRKKRYADRLRHNVQLSLEMAITDQLTGLHNRRYMSRHLDNLLSQTRKSAASRSPSSSWTSIIFKSVNDTYGHDIGDEVLKRIRQTHRRQCARHRSGLPLWRRGIRGGDARYRRGLRLLRSPSACARAIETTPFAISRAPGKLNITISIGIAEVGRRGRHRRSAASSRRPGALSRQTHGPQPRRRRRGLINLTVLESTLRRDRHGHAVGFGDDRDLRYVIAGQPRGQHGVNRQSGVCDGRAATRRHGDEFHF